MNVIKLPKITLHFIFSFQLGSSFWLKFFYDIGGSAEKNAKTPVFRRKITVVITFRGKIVAVTGISLQNSAVSRLFQMLVFVLFKMLFRSVYYVSGPSSKLFLFPEVEKREFDSRKKIFETQPFVKKRQLR